METNGAMSPGYGCHQFSLNQSRNPTPLQAKPQQGFFWFCFVEINRMTIKFTWKSKRHQITRLEEQNWKTYTLLDSKTTVIKTV